MPHPVLPLDDIFASQKAKKITIPPRTVLVAKFTKIDLSVCLSVCLFVFDIFLQIGSTNSNRSNSWLLCAYGMGTQGK